ncbi:hypothetical protein RF55_25863, partial [Lasius niger]
MSYRDALMSTQVPQQTNPNQTRPTPPEAPQPSNMEQMFARFEGMVERMMEKMFSQMTQLVASILNAKMPSMYYWYQKPTFVPDPILALAATMSSLPTIHLAERAEEQPCSSGVASSTRSYLRFRRN